jgi:hypothetical protein
MAIIANKGLLTKIITVTAIRWTVTFWTIGQSFQRLYLPSEDRPSPKIICLRSLYLKYKRYIHSWLLMVHQTRRSLQTRDIKYNCDTPQRQVSQLEAFLYRLECYDTSFTVSFFTANSRLNVISFSNKHSFPNEIIFGLINGWWCESLIWSQELAPVFSLCLIPGEFELYSHESAHGSPGHSNTRVSS